ncbi:EF-hand 7 domain containing protein [Asbolus verrucosus]|uniref:EF-hand 7 domain containing protein n=1 Tax=Asbolus verrucosus TaxID=1661398 RepID=A0A482VRG7_ASBVE|nr:EF-hand 7 domain containing protein [Asbolus verrucosus]
MSGSDSSGVCPEQQSSEAQRWFDSVDQDHSGRINRMELQSALIDCQGRKFSEIACKLMIEMFDGDHSGTINRNEFQQLFGYVNQWVAVFEHHDKDHSGYVDERELSQALQEMGYKLSLDFIKMLMRKCDLQNCQQVTVDQFVVICVQIQRLTEAFRVRDKEMKGVITIGFEDFLNVALNCYVI